jgi:hypothetical protein
MSNFSTMFTVSVLLAAGPECNSGPTYIIIKGERFFNKVWKTGSSQLRTELGWDSNSCEKSSKTNHCELFTSIENNLREV